MQDIIANVKKFGFPLGRYSVVGGGALAARGIRTYDDVDLIVTEDLYEQLKKSDWEEKEKHPGCFHLYKDNAEVTKNFLNIKGCKLNPADVIKNSEIIDGIPFMSLNDLIELKKAIGREKDIKDIELILKFMNR
jgi:hypothetical protein